MFLRGNKWYGYVINLEGKRTQVATGYPESDRAAAERWVADEQRKIDIKREALIASGLAAGPLTVNGFAGPHGPWIPHRKALELDWKNDEQRLRDHILPYIGHLEMDKVRASHIAAMITELRTKGHLSQKTIYTVYSIVCALFRDAEVQDLIERQPSRLSEYELGPLHDVDPADADKDGSEAVFDHDELTLLISDSRIWPVSHIVYGLGGLAGLRHGEYAGLRWFRWDVTKKPLGKLTITTSYDLGRTKTRVIRRIPVHPTLAAMLAEWKASGWADMMGRPPGPDDLIVPWPPDPPKKQARPNPRAGGMRSAKDTGKRWETDLKILGLRYRKGHDLRATFVTLAEADGADPNVIRKLTHTPRDQSAYDIYSRTQWATMCREVVKLNITRPGYGTVIPLPTNRAISMEPHPHDSQNRDAVLMQSVQPSEIMAEKWRSGRDSNPIFLPDNDGRRMGFRLSDETAVSVGGNDRGTPASNADAVTDYTAVALESALRAWRDGRDRDHLRQALERILFQL